MLASHANARRLFVHAADALALVDELQGGAFVATRLACKLAAEERILLSIYAQGCVTVAELPCVVIGRSFEPNNSVGVVVKLTAPTLVQVEHSAYDA
jgi:hypothetical protein